MIFTYIDLIIVNFSRDDLIGASVWSNIYLLFGFGNKFHQTSQQTQTFLKKYWHLDCCASRKFFLQFSASGKRTFSDKFAYIAQLKW